MSAHYVYRAYDASGRLLYVGYTNDLFRRLRAHQYSWWAADVDRVKAKVYPTRAAARAAEVAAIDSEGPRFNVIGRFKHSLTWGREEFADYITALEHLPPTDYTRARLANVRSLYRIRFGVAS